MPARLPLDCPIRSDALLTQPAEQLRQGQRATRASHFDAALEQDQRRDRANAHFSRELRVGFAVQLAQAAVTLQLRGGLLIDRSKAAAGAAPTGPDINQQRQVALVLRGGVGLGQFERCARQYLRFAAAATWRIAQALGGNAIETIAVRAGAPQRGGHWP